MSSLQSTFSISAYSMQCPTSSLKFSFPNVALNCVRSTISRTSMDQFELWALWPSFSQIHFVSINGTEKVHLTQLLEATCVNPLPNAQNLHDIQGSTNRRALGFVNFVLALAYHFCLNLLPAFSQPGACLLVEPCITHLSYWTFVLLRWEGESQVCLSPPHCHNADRCRAGQL